MSTETRGMLVLTLGGVALALCAILLVVLYVPTIHHSAPNTHPSPTSTVTESKVLYSVPVTYQGMECVKQVDTNGNIWINDCTRSTP